MSTGATPFLLMYGTEAILPVEIELPSLRISAATNLSPDDDEYCLCNIFPKILLTK